MKHSIEYLNQYAVTKLLIPIFFGCVALMASVNLSEQGGAISQCANELSNQAESITSSRSLGWGSMARVLP